MRHQPSIIKTHLQLGRQSFSRAAPSIFELSRNTSLLDSLQEALSQDAAAAADLSPRLSSSSSRLFSPRVSFTQLTAADSLSAAAAFSRSISLRHTPTLAQLPAQVQDVLEGCGALFIEDGNIEGLAEAASHFIAESGTSETFYVYDLGEVARLHNTWRAALPRVAPHYAVKCNPEPMMLAMLAALGAGFDCASVMELEAVEALGVSQDHIIFANPCKKPADFRYAVAHGVQTTTFDTPCELHKIAQLNPRFRCVLRIRCDDPTAKCPLGAKYGADMPEVPGLLQLARELGLQVVGVSFHVGSGCQDVSVYDEAIKRARSVFDMAEQQYGFPPLTLLDIGGGFTAPCDEPSSALFRQTARTINAALDRASRQAAAWRSSQSQAGAPHARVHGAAPTRMPGGFFVETSATLFTTVLGHREGRDACSGHLMAYWLSDSSQGSFRIQVRGGGTADQLTSCRSAWRLLQAVVVIDGLEPSYLVLRNPLLPSITSEQAEPQDGAAHTAGANDSPFGHFETLHSSRLMGISGKDNDVIHAHAQLPRLRYSDWLMFPYAGAYTISSASNYTKGAFLLPARLFVFSSEADKGWGDVLPQSAVVSMVSIPQTIPEGDVLEHEEQVSLDGLLEPLGSLALDGARSGSLQPGRSMQRALSRVPSMPRG
ncbi:pyridoxal-dependent decarboxylase [Scenedesmus sp. NREL 46B-D3]|nr:pyridoxal-dependent decarboxylase [Scenedesmus sp. NREL 46B-D3]